LHGKIFALMKGRSLYSKFKSLKKECVFASTVSINLKDSNYKQAFAAFPSGPVKMAFINAGDINCKSIAQPEKQALPEKIQNDPLSWHVL